MTSQNINFDNDCTSNTAKNTEHTIIAIVKRTYSNFTIRDKNTQFEISRLSILFSYHLKIFLLEWFFGTPAINLRTRFMQWTRRCANEVYLYRVKTVPGPITCLEGFLSWKLQQELILQEINISSAWLSSAGQFEKHISKHGTRTSFSQTADFGKTPPAPRYLQCRVVWLFTYVRSPSGGPAIFSHRISHGEGQQNATVAKATILTGHL